MAEHISRTYTCDRCGFLIGPNPNQGSRVVKLHASVSYPSEPGTQFEWGHLCTPCGADILSFLKAS